MLNNISIEIVAIVVFILFNGVLAMSEIAIISSRKTKLQHLSKKGHSGAGVALKLAEEPNSFLSTLQIGITLVGILSGAFGGATIAEELAAFFITIPIIAPYAEAIGIGVVVLVIGYFTLIFGELVPKRLGMKNPERIAILLAKPIRLMSVIFHPIVLLLGLSTNIVLTLLRVKHSDESEITEDEIKILVEQGTHQGVFENAEKEIIEKAFKLDDMNIESLMTQSLKVVWLNINDSPERMDEKINKHHYSCFPVCDGQLDKVIGMVYLKSLYSMRCDLTAPKLKTVILQPLFIPEGTKALKVMLKFKETGVHTALIIDEYGATKGLVTLNDILEALVGDFQPEQSDKPNAMQRDDGSWLVDGDYSIGEFKQLFHIGTLPDEESNRYHTLAGFIIMHLGHIPKTTDHFIWNGFRFEIVDTDGKKIDKILVSAEKNLASQ